MWQRKKKTRIYPLLRSARFATSCILRSKTEVVKFHFVFSLCPHFMWIKPWFFSEKHLESKKRPKWFARSEKLQVFHFIGHELLLIDSCETHCEREVWPWRLVWVFFRTEISESNLPKQIFIWRLSNSRIREYVKIELKFHVNFSIFFDNGLTKNIFWTFKIFFEQN